MRSLLALVLALGLGACAGLGPRTVRVSQAELEGRLAQQFPRQQRVMELVDVTFATPRLRLLPERNRVATELDFTAADRLSGRPWRGAIALDYALRFEPADASVRLAQVRVDRVSLEGGGGALPVVGQRLGALLAERLLDDQIVWRAQPEQLARLQRAGGATGVVNVTAAGLEVTLTPAR